MTAIKIKISKDFSRTPGPRYIHEGNFSGEDFREKILYPKLLSALSNKQSLEVNLDGTAGYGTSFLEESFGGLIRVHHLDYNNISNTLILVSEEEDYLIDDVKVYLKEANEERKIEN